MLGQTQRTLQREAAKEATKEKRNARNTKVLNMLSEIYIHISRLQPLWKYLSRLLNESQENMDILANPKITVKCE